MSWSAGRRLSVEEGEKTVGLFKFLVCLYLFTFSFPSFPSSFLTTPQDVVSVTGRVQNDDRGKIIIHTAHTLGGGEKKVDGARELIPANPSLPHRQPTQKHSTFFFL